MMQSNRLLLEKVSVIYNNGVHALDNVSFTLASGSICALVGVNGSGKSTLFKSIMGVIKPTKGNIRFNDHSIIDALKRNLIAYVPQTEEVDWDFPVRVYDVVMMGRYGHMGFLRIPSSQDKHLVDQALEKVDLLPLKYRQIGQLSGGQKKRVFLARALAQQGQVMLLDEPFTGVDVQTENAIVQLLKQLRQEGYLILVSTHNLGSVPEFCDHAVLINRRLLAVGPIEQTFTRENLELAFGGMLRHINIAGSSLHEDEDPRSLSVLTDDERPAIFYGVGENQIPQKSLQNNQN